MTGEITETQSDDKKTWTVTKNGKNYTVTDVNKNGIWDATDTIQNSDGTAATGLTAEDLFVARYKSKKEPNYEEVQTYQEYQQLVEKNRTAQEASYRAEIKHEYSLSQTNTPKKKSWIDKAISWFNLFGQAFNTIGQFGFMFSAFDSNNWAYGNCNDCNLMGYNNLANTTMAMSTMLPYMTGSYTNPYTLDMSSLTSLNLTGSSSSSTTVTTAKKKATEAQSALDKFLEENTPSAAAEQAEYDRLNGILSSIYDDVENDLKINSKTIDELTAIGKRSFTEADKRKIELISKYKYVNVELITKGTIDETDAQKINALITKAYTQLLDKGTDLREAILELIAAMNDTNATSDSINAKCEAVKEVLEEE